MSDQAGRNDLCPCGSGKKMKACHPNGYGTGSKNRNFLFIGIGIAVVAVAGVAMLQGEQQPPAQTTPSRPMTTPATNAPARSTATPLTQGNTTAQPGAAQPGPAPPGKVWSTEHGHWHDDPTAAGANAGAQITPGQPSQIQMPAVQNANPRGVANSPQPPGPAPEGKVWNAEHGHWHDAPQTPPQMAPVTPAKTDP